MSHIHSKGNVHGKLSFVPCIRDSRDVWFNNKTLPKTTVFTLHRVVIKKSPEDAFWGRSAVSLACVQRYFVPDFVAEAQSRGKCVDLYVFWFVWAKGRCRFLMLLGRQSLSSRQRQSRNQGKASFGRVMIELSLQVWRFLLRKSKHE